MKGQVYDIYKDDCSVVLLVNMTKNTEGLYFGDTVWVDCSYKDDEKNYKKNEIVDIKDVIIGHKTYTSVANTEETLPQIKAQTIEHIK